MKTGEAALRLFHCPKQLVRVPTDQFTRRDDSDADLCTTGARFVHPHRCAGREQRLAPMKLDRFFPIGASMSPAPIATAATSASCPRRAAAVKPFPSSRATARAPGVPAQPARPSAPSINRGVEHRRTIYAQVRITSVNVAGASWMHSTSIARSSTSRARRAARPLANASDGTITTSTLPTEVVRQPRRLRRRRTVLRERLHLRPDLAAYENPASRRYGGAQA